MLRDVADNDAWRRLFVFQTTVSILATTGDNEKDKVIVIRYMVKVSHQMSLYQGVSFSLSESTFQVIRAPSQQQQTILCSVASFLFCPIQCIQHIHIFLPPPLSIPFSLSFISFFFKLQLSYANRVPAIHKVFGQPIGSTSECSTDRIKYIVFFHPVFPVQCKRAPSQRRNPTRDCSYRIDHVDTRI